MTSVPNEAVRVFRFGPIDPAAMATWARILRDSNPIHLDVEAVKAMGLGSRRINQGPANLAYVMNAVLLAFPTGSIRQITARFIDNVFEGEVVEARCSLIEAENADDGTCTTCRFELIADQRGPVVSGSAIVFSPHG